MTDDPVDLVAQFAQAAQRIAEQVAKRSWPVDVQVDWDDDQGTWSRPTILWFGSIADGLDDVRALVSVIRVSCAAIDLPSRAAGSPIGYISDLGDPNERCWLLGVRTDVHAALRAIAYNNDRWNHQALEVAINAVTPAEQLVWQCTSALCDLAERHLSDTEREASDHPYDIVLRMTDDERELAIAIANQFDGPPDELVNVVRSIGATTAAR